METVAPPRTDRGKGGHLHAYAQHGKLNLHRLDELARTLSDIIKNAGREIILVTSGAIAVGASKLGMEGRPTELRLKQAAASVGQCELMHNLRQALFRIRALRWGRSC